MSRLRLPPRFVPDNGPWLVHNQSAGSEGLITGRASGYWNTGKGSTWDGETAVRRCRRWCAVPRAGIASPAALGSPIAEKPEADTPGRFAVPHGDTSFLVRHRRDPRAGLCLLARTH